MTTLLKKLLSGKSTTIISAAVIVAAASLASRLLGVLRDRILAGEFGAGSELDIYYAAFRLPDLVYSLIVAGALSAGFIPIFAELVNGHKHPRNAWRVANGVLNILVVGLAILCALLAIFAPWIIPVITPGFDSEKLELTILLSRIMFLSPFFLGLSAVFGGILQTYKRFILYSFAPIFYNVGIIIGALFFVDIWGLKGLAIGVVIGAFLHMAVQIPGAYILGWRYQATMPWQDKNIIKIGKMMVPRVMSLAVNNINLIIITAIASTLAAGSIAVFNLANNLQYFPIGIIGFSFAIAAFPTISEFAAEKSWVKYKKAFSNTVRDILFFIIPASVIFLLLRAQIVRVVLGYGQFTWEDTILTADALAFFALSLFAQSILPLLVRMFFAIKDTTIPFLSAFVSVLLNVILSLWLINYFGVVGLALAFSISSIFNVVLLWIILRAKVGYLYEYPIIRSLYKISVAALAMGLVIQVSKIVIEPFLNMQKFWGIFTQGAFAAILGLLVYGAICLILRSPEMLNFKASVQRRLFKKYYKPKEGIDIAGKV
ncbi:murein biosynthesis integral membrane protein MurJ [Candidatus Saccharibacteria bacterium]|nr:murein biosynthesis integral membrane protein MurJ [Candidatus Saccharibacteria bacterium]NIV03236.1 murein biosynthesis integral membrane protein MurJ [Calditrichia bacterium]NIS37749.1 murein biosynthesis integral membrane protein MurJ [Candidatus Saccharibacteria bacterium]NIV71357.1 murein biosynthesis integral membrane protein MurJ [Calditrichia bacterium]NIV97873.1 murein biosynthesis integral membrane protein MurJ [Candidatus Saccharibacteria bacterium]